MPRQGAAGLAVDTGGVLQLILESRIVGQIRDMLPLLGGSFRTPCRKGNVASDFDDLSLGKLAKSFVLATGGGIGQFENQDEGRQNDKVSAFRQQSNAMSGSNCLGFGRIKFADQDLPANYVRVPWKLKSTGQSSGIDIFHTHPQMLLYYVENVWNLQRPRILISITGGAVDFTMSEDKERVLYELMSAANHTDAWLVTGGSNSGIMKYVGQFLIYFAKSYRCGVVPTMLAGFAVLWPGEARRRFGGNIPLIGIATWGVMQDTKKLAVRVLWFRLF